MNRGKVINGLERALIARGHTERTETYSSSFGTSKGYPKMQGEVDGLLSDGIGQQTFAIAQLY